MRHHACNFWSFSGYVLAAERRILALLLLHVLVFGCTAPRPYYSGFHFDAPPLVESDRSRLVVYLDEMIRSEKVKRLTIVTPDRGEQSIYPRDDSSPPTIDWLPLPVLFATRFILNPKHKGLEVDFLVETEAEGVTPVSALAEPDGSLRVEMGEPSKSMFAAERELGRQELAARFGIGAVVEDDQSWKPLELYSLEKALSLLTKEERAVLSGVAFVRKQRADNGGNGLSADMLWGLYQGRVDERDQREIHLYDTKGNHDVSIFIGEPSRPYPITTMCLLHEIGHAIADYARARAVYVHSQDHLAHKNLVTAWNSLVEAGQLTAEKASELQGELAVLKANEACSSARLEATEKLYDKNFGPVYAVYREIRRNGKGPTPYGRTSIKESFADAFALYKADPAALRRIDPNVYSWFTEGGHIRALRAAMGDDAIPLEGANQPLQRMAASSPSRGL